MASIVIEINGSDYTDDVISYLTRKSLKLVHNYKTDVPQDSLVVGLALRHPTGVQARIMSKDKCKEDGNYLFTISNNSITKEKMYELFWKW